MWNYQACKVILACLNIQQETESARLNERRQLAREVLQQRDLEGIPRYFEPISGFPRLGSDLQEITRLPWTQWTGVCKPGSFEGIWKAIGDQTYIQENYEAKWRPKKQQSPNYGASRGIPKLLRVKMVIGIKMAYRPTNQMPMTILTPHPADLYLKIPLVPQLPQKLLKGFPNGVQQFAIPPQRESQHSQGPNGHWHRNGLQTDKFDANVCQ